MDIFILAGLILIAFQILVVLIKLIKIFLLGYKKTKGTVVGYDEDRDSDGNIVYSPIIEYYVEGNYYQHSPKISSNFKSRIGKEKTIYYNPKKPAKAFVLFSMVHLMVLIFGIVFTIVSYYLTIMLSL